MEIENGCDEWGVAIDVPRVEEANSRTGPGGRRRKKLSVYVGGGEAKHQAA